MDGALSRLEARTHRRLERAGKRHRSQGLLIGLLLSLLLAGCTGAQGTLSASPSNDPGNVILTNHASRRDSGSARKLIGPVVIQHIFLTDEDSDWPMEMQMQARRRTERASEFLLGEAEKYGVKLSIAHRWTVAPPQPSPVPVDMFASPDWMENAVGTLNHSSVNRLVRAVVAEHPGSQVAVFFHVNKSADSYSLAHYGGVSDRFHGERAVIFSRYRDSRPTAAATIAHEILHCFGAGELYFPFDRTPDRKRLARKLFPNDVMYRVEYDIFSLEIGAWTAYRIGWIGELDAKYKAFED